MSNTLESKLKIIRQAEGMTQKTMSELTGVPLGTIKNYESGHSAVGIHVLQTILATRKLQKYTLWLMTGNAAPAAGQIAPPVVPEPPRKKAG